MNQLKLKVITPERLVLEEDFDGVSLPTTEGEITILPDHVPLIAGLASGDIVAHSGGDELPMAVVGGFLEVKSVPKALLWGDPQSKALRTEVIVLADFAEHVSELGEEKIEQAKARAEELRKQMENKEVIDFEHFAAELERSLTRVRIAEKWRTKKYRK